jgi:serine/threonine-protein kinase
MIGEKLGPFRIEEKIGQGAMGVVYKATFEPSGQLVAVKVVSQDQAARGNAVDRFQRESDILKQFRHPNIVQHVGMGFSRSRNLSYYAMEFVPGPTLDLVLAERGPLPWKEVVELGRQICEALQYSHERGIVHRDLKPSNLLIAPSGRIKLSDFGIAKDLDRTALTATGRTLGTAAYMAPEQIRGTPEVSHKTDLYALGCLFYQMLTGSPPFEGGTTIVLMHKHLEETPPRPSARTPDIPKALDRLVVKLMAKNRDDRPWDAQAVAHELDELAAKSDRGDPIPMVFGDVPELPMRAPGGSAPAFAPPTQATGSDRADTRTRGRGKKSRGKAGSTEAAGASIGSTRRIIETMGLVLGLVVVGGIIGYQLWPPSARYLYTRASEAMAAGKTRADWILAQRAYVDELERRYPDHPYQKEVRGWKDQLLMEQAEGRARFLENPNLLALSQTKNDIEAAYQRAYRATAEMLKEGRDVEALKTWRALAETLQGDDDDRMWYLLAKSRGDQVESQAKSRLREATRLFLEAIVAERAGRGDEADRGRRELIERFGRYESLRDLVAQARSRLNAADPGPAETTSPAPMP